MKLEEIKNKTNEAVSYLVEALEKGQSEVLSEYLNAMARFHQYSFGNIMLIARQRPTATRVAGIRTWNLLGRFVKRGEKAILILAPMVGAEISRVMQSQRRSQPTTQPIIVNRKRSYTGFVPCTYSMSARPKAKSCQA